MIIISHYSKYYKVSYNGSSIIIIKLKIFHTTDKLIPVLDKNDPKKDKIF